LLDSLLQEILREILAIYVIGDHGIDLGGM